MPKTNRPSDADTAFESPEVTSASEARPMTKAKAEKVTTLITSELNTMGAAREAIEAAYEAALPLINEAYACQAHKALGYDTWESYVHDRFGDQLMRLGVDLRRRVAKELAEAGMSTSAIAPILGVGQSTVDRDLRQLTQMGNLNRPAIVTGRDGKQYRLSPAQDRIRETRRRHQNGRCPRAGADAATPALRQDRGPSARVAEFDHSFGGLG